MATRTTLRRRAWRAALLSLSTAALAACEDEASPTGPIVDPSLNAIVTTQAINASSVDTLVGFSFTTGGTVAMSGDWDIALRRYEVRFNGGVSGAKGVVGAALDNNRLATDAQVLAFTVENTLAAFDAVRASQVPDDTAFKGDRLVANATGYLNLGGVPTANAAAYWKVKLANGSYGAFRVTAIVLSQSFALTSVTVESRLQTGATLGAAQSVTVPITGAPVSISLATNQAVTPNGCNWDIAVSPQSFGIAVNAGCGAGTSPGGVTPTFAALTVANDGGEYGAFLAGLTGPVPNSVTDAGAPFRYNLENTNRLHPTFNTYLVKVGTKVYKLQVINYYSAAGASGFPTLRYALIK